MNGKAMRLDLRPEREVFLNEIRQAAKEFDLSKIEGPITRIDILYDVSSAEFPYVWATLDNQKDGEPGHTSDPPQFFFKKCEHWSEACFGLIGEEGTTIVITDAAEQTATDEESICEAIGLFLVEIIKTLRDTGAFKHLPVASKCYLGVSTYDGVWGWPHYKNRGKDDLL
jgi:hypothetical protein